MESTAGTGVTVDPILADTAVVEYRYVTSVICAFSFGEVVAKDDTLDLSLICVLIAAEVVVKDDGLELSLIFAVNKAE